MLCAPGRKRSVCRAINMDLPAQSRQRVKIVQIVSRYSRQAISAMDITCFALTQKAAAIVQRDLGNRPEQELARELKSDDF